MEMLIARVFRLFINCTVWSTTNIFSNCLSLSVCLSGGVIMIISNKLMLRTVNCVLISLERWGGMEGCLLNYFKHIDSSILHFFVVVCHTEELTVVHVVENTGKSTALENKAIVDNRLHPQCAYCRSLLSRPIVDKYG